MATKLIAVTLANIQNTGDIPVSPRGFIACQTVRAQDDQQVFQSEILYDSNQGTIRIPPGESRSFNVMRQLTVSHFDDSESEGLNQGLLILSELKQNFVANGSQQTENYFGSRKKVRFDDITGFDTVTMFQTPLVQRQPDSPPLIRSVSSGKIGATSGQDGELTSQ